jgi:hypothetical protein
MVTKIEIFFQVLAASNKKKKDRFSIIVFHIQCVFSFTSGMVLDSITLGGETTVNSSGLETNTGTLDGSGDLRVEDTRSHVYVNGTREGWKKKSCFTISKKKVREGLKFFPAPPNSFNLRHL